MHLDLDKVRANVRAATTEDLLDRATVYRAGMEPEALDLIERELRERGIGLDAIVEHERKQSEETLFDSEGIARKCYRCPNPAVGEGREWHRLWGLLPIFRRHVAWCARHAPKTSNRRTGEQGASAP
jgi:hypothetical protein